MIAGIRLVRSLDVALFHLLSPFRSPLFPAMKTLLLLSSLFIPALLLRAAEEPTAAETDVYAGRLVQVQKVQADSLRSATSVAVSPDGKFVYAAAFNADAVTVFKRDSGTGELEPDYTFTGPDLDAVVSLRLSRDGEYAVASAFRANAITLYKRDAKTGALHQLDVARQGEHDNDGLDFVIDGEFSKDGRLLYTAAANGVGVYLINEDKLVFQQLMSADGKLGGLRDVTLSPDGSMLYAAGARTGTVGVLRPDAASGKLEVVQLLTDGEDGNNALAGAFRIACSPKGEHVYVSAGRFGGDQAVSVYGAQPDGTLKLVEEHVNGVGDFKGFEGGNTLAVSPDGTRLYALATISDRIAAFTREPATGKLTFQGTQPAGDFATPGCPGLCFSPDGRFLYVADENSHSVLVYKVP